MKNWYTAFFVSIILSISLLLTLVIDRSYQVYMSYQHPYVFTEAGATETTIKSGQPLNLIYGYDHNRLCRTDLVRFIVRKEDNSVVWRDRVPGGAAPLGKNQKVLNTVALPNTIAPGRYVFRLMVFSTCTEAEHQVPGPDIEFEIIP